ncbi:MAG: carbohydrate-binding protein [Chloroflexi bacterium]|nr:carbohydrate-binding protein [Chloroflexota bacterium]
MKRWTEMRLAVIGGLIIVGLLGVRWVTAVNFLPAAHQTGISVTPTLAAYLPYIAKESGRGSPTVIPTSTPTSSPTSTPTSTATPTLTPTHSPTSTPSSTASPTPTTTPTPDGCPYGPTDLGFGVHLQFEDFNCGGEGAAYHDIDPINLGGQYRPDEGVDLGIAIGAGWGDSYFIGWTENGEWVKYDIVVTQPDHYYFRALVSSVYDTAVFHLELDGIDITGPIAVPDTGGEQNWTLINLIPSGYWLDPDKYTLTLVIGSGGGNYDLLRAYPATPTPISEHSQP